ncbi:hypothetical protein F5884DRAFT_837503 [Xylogone sp. PMI_703]|nr:hypothetical protein F5884DRAFT_837503 [Xylogone sp. PMI_703]
MRLVDDSQSVRLVEIYNVDIVRVICLEEYSSGFEVLFTVRITKQSDIYIDADVTCYSGTVDAAQPLGTPKARLTAHFGGHVQLWLGQPIRMHYLNSPNLYCQWTINITIRNRRSAKENTPTVDAWTRNLHGVGPTMGGSAIKTN